MYKTNRGLIEWTLDIESFKPEFQRKCKEFHIDPGDVKFILNKMKINISYNIY